MISVRKLIILRNKILIILTIDHVPRIYRKPNLKIYRPIGIIFTLQDISIFSSSYIQTRSKDSWCLVDEMAVFERSEMKQNANGL